MTLHLKSRGYPFRPRLLFSSFIVVGVGFPTVYYFRRGQVLLDSSVENFLFLRGYFRFPRELLGVYCNLPRDRSDEMNLLELFPSKKRHPSDEECPFFG